MSFDYENFFEEIEENLSIYAHNLDKIIFQAPNIHNKLLKRWVVENNKLQKLEIKKDRVFGERFHFYRYEYEINITSNDIAKYYVKKDNDYLKTLKEYNKQLLLVETLNKWLKKADKIYYEVKNALEVLKYLNGGT